MNWSLLLIHFAADHFEGWFPVDHGRPSELLLTPWTLQAPPGKVLHDSLLVALDQRPLSPFFVSLFQITATKGVATVSGGDGRQGHVNISGGVFNSQTVVSLKYSNWIDCQEELFFCI